MARRPVIYALTDIAIIVPVLRMSGPESGQGTTLAAMTEGLPSAARFAGYAARSSLPSQTGI